MFKFSFTTQCLITAWAAAIFSYYLGTLYGSHWFSRSGSLIVLFSIMSEYILLKERNDYIFGKINSKEFKKAIHSMKAVGVIQPEKPHVLKEKATHISVVFGTLIWGYGDLL